MRKLHCFSFGIIICCLMMIGIVYGQGVQDIRSSSDTTPKTDVATIFKNPLPFLDKQLTLTGVVAVSFPNEQMFMFTDLVGCGSASASGCGSKCSLNIIPVTYSGQIPKVKDIVQISGTLIKDKDNKVVFNATVVTSQ